MTVYGIAAFVKEKLDLAINMQNIFLNHKIDVAFMEQHIFKFNP